MSAGTLHLGAQKTRATLQILLLLALSNSLILSLPPVQVSLVE